MGWCRGGEERRHTEAVDEGVDSGEARRGWDGEARRLGRVMAVARRCWLWCDNNVIVRWRNWPWWQLGQWSGGLQSLMENCHLRQPCFAKARWWLGQHVWRVIVDAGVVADEALNNDSGFDAMGIGGSRFMHDSVGGARQRLIRSLNFYLCLFL